MGLGAAISHLGGHVGLYANVLSSVGVGVEPNNGHYGLNVVIITIITFVAANSRTPLLNILHDGLPFEQRRNHVELGDVRINRKNKSL